MSLGGSAQFVRQNVGVDEFEALIGALVDRDGVTVGGGRGFGANALQIDGRIFAMSNDAGLVLKLPRDASRRWWHQARACRSTPARAGR